MNPDCETLRAELHAEIDRRIDALEKKAADVEPPMLTMENWTQADRIYRLPGWPLAVKMKDRLRYVEAELARLREGLKWQDGDVDEERLALWGPDKISRWIGSMAREIQRHRALVKP